MIPKLAFLLIVFLLTFISVWSLSVWLMADVIKSTDTFLVMTFGAFAWVMSCLIALLACILLKGG